MKIIHWFACIVACSVILTAQSVVTEAAQRAPAATPATPAADELFKKIYPGERSSG